jgi:hypothetical protein
MGTAKKAVFNELLPNLVSFAESSEIFPNYLKLEVLYWCKNIKLAVRNDFRRGRIATRVTTHDDAQGAPTFRMCPFLPLH